MIKRTDSNSHGDTFNRVKIELVTDKHWQKIHAVCYPNYDNTIRIRMNTPGLGFDIDKDHVRDLIEVLKAALRACE